MANFASCRDALLRYHKIFNYMINGKRIAVVMPAYNAEKTLELTVRGTPATGRHSYSRGRQQLRQYGGVWRGGWVCTSFFTTKLRLRAQPADLLSRGAGGGADVVIMLHPDYQYTPLLDDRHGQYGGLWGLRRYARLAHYRWDGADGRHAGLQIRREPGAHGVRKSISASEALRVPHWISSLQP